MARMTNREIIETELIARGIDFPYDGQNLLTFAEWKKRGCYVRRGEKAFLRVPLWTVGTKKVTKDGQEVEEKYFFLKTAYLFHPGQVEQAKRKQSA